MSKINLGIIENSLRNLINQNNEDSQYDENVENVENVDINKEKYTNIEDIFKRNLDYLKICNIVIILLWSILFIMITKKWFS